MGAEVLFENPVADFWSENVVAEFLSVAPLTGAISTLPPAILILQATNAYQMPWVALYL